MLYGDLPKAGAARSAKLALRGQAKPGATRSQNISIGMLCPCQSFSGYSQDATFVNNKYLTDALG